MAKKFIVEFWNGDLNQVLGIYESTFAAMGAVLYHVVTTVGSDIPEFGITTRGDSGYDCYYDILVSYTKKADGGYDFTENYIKNHIERYRVFYLTHNIEDYGKTEENGEKP